MSIFFYFYECTVTHEDACLIVRLFSWITSTKSSLFPCQIDYSTNSNMFSLVNIWESLKHSSFSNSTPLVAAISHRVKCRWLVDLIWLILNPWNGNCCYSYDMFLCSHIVLNSRRKNMTGSIQTQLLDTLLRIRNDVPHLSNSLDAIYSICKFKNGLLFISIMKYTCWG